MLLIQSLEPCLHCLFLNSLPIAALVFFVFFIPISVGGKETIPLDHIVSWLRGDYAQMTEIYAILVVLAGGAYSLHIG